MSIISGGFATRLSGGSGNSSGDASLGGVKSSTAAPTTLNGLFDLTSAAEAVAGDVEYRAIYLHNANATDTMTNAVAYISSNTPLAGSTIDIGVGTAAINGTEQTIADESTAPTGVTFSAPANADSGIALGNIPAGQHIAIWLRRTITAGAGSSPSDAFTIGYRCETT
jgi:hypothetical protein